MTIQRELTEAESRVLNLLRLFDSIVSDNKATAKLELTPLAYSIVKEKKIAKPLRVTFNSYKNLHNVIFNVEEFYKYVTYCCKRVGFKILIDGSVQTIDGLILSEEVLQ